MLLFDLDVFCCEIVGFEVVKICEMVVLVGVGMEVVLGDVFIFSVCMELDLGGM